MVEQAKCTALFDQLQNRGSILLQDWQRTLLVLWFLLLTALTGSASHGQTELASAEASFKYVASTLQTFRRTGRLADNPGVDGSDLEHYIELLETSYTQFSRDFDRDSAMCTFYMHPENGRMTIEDRAELAFSLLPDLSVRIARYIAVDKEFQLEVEDHFGSMLLRNINSAKAASLSNQRLPSARLEQSAIINFLDNACV